MSRKRFISNHRGCELLEICRVSILICVGHCKKKKLKVKIKIDGNCKSCIRSKIWYLHEGVWECGCGSAFFAKNKPVGKLAS